MKFGVREICDVVLRAKTKMNVGSKVFYANEPVIYFDSLTTSSLEGAATTNYASGGRGNARLLAWEGERTLTFNMTDALISPEGFAILSGADVIDASNEVPMYVHSTARTEVKGDNTKAYVVVKGKVAWSHKARAEFYNAGADIFLMDDDGNLAIPYDDDNSVKYDATTKTTTIECYDFAPGTIVLVDYYTIQTKGKQIDITPDKFGGYFYLEASTLFRDEASGQDLPAEFIIPRCKVQSNFTFTMASTGDPSTFDFVLDAFPDYTKFNNEKKVLAALQVVEELDADEAADGQQEREHTAKSAGIATWTSEDNFEHKTGYNKTTGNYSNEDDTIASGDFELTDGN